MAGVAMSSNAARVLAIVANVKQFRLPFYTRLTADLERRGVEFRVAYSAPDATEGTKGASIDLPDSFSRKCSRLYLLGGRLLLQAVPLSELARADLVIIVQANGYLLNYPLLLASKLRIKRVAFWGHGYNHQARSDQLQERFRRLIVNLPDWWFAYTDRTSAYLRESGVAAGKISVINNAVDTSAFAAEVAGVTGQELQSLRAELDVPSSAPIGLYCGSLYAHKHLDFLLEASARIQQAIPDFVLVVIGAGPERASIERSANEFRWMRYLGPQFGSKKAVAFRAASLFLNPGLVGLAILDSFAAGLPLITTDVRVHSPEIAYLRPGENGLMLPHDTAEYSRGVVELVLDSARLTAMGASAAESGRNFTLDAMVNNVTRGITDCLEAYGKRPTASRAE
jgi:L-malate glycosyltransferase